MQKKAGAAKVGARATLNVQLELPPLREASVAQTAGRHAVHSMQRCREADNGASLLQKLIFMVQAYVNAEGVQRGQVLMAVRTWYARDRFQI